MVHIEMSYLTHSKFFTTMIPDILPLFRARFRIFWWILYFEFSSTRDLKLFFPSCAQGFRFFNKLILCPSIHVRFRVFFLLSSSAWGFGFFTNWCSAPLSARDLEFFWKKILLSSFVRGLKPISDTSILLHPRFWIFQQTDSLLLCPREV